jgi:GH15 family glucan-1,4-alpha-glucosidase
MAAIEDYALLGDLHTAALVAKDGAIDWLCVPRFDGGACFCALLGDERHGTWQISPVGPILRTARRYVPETLVLVTELETSEGALELVDFMPPRSEALDLVRRVRCVRGRVTVRMRCRIRFDYGRIDPWVTREGRLLTAVAGPDRLTLAGADDAEQLVPEIVCVFTLSAGERRDLVLTWSPSYADPPAPTEPARALDDTLAFWRSWSARCTYRGPYRDVVLRSLITLKALTYAPTGGVVAAVTTSLPEQWRGPRNWDYRYCWLRDATFTLYALLSAGYREEAAAWRDWLVRAVAGDPGQLQIMYGIAGERRLTEQELDWLPGYEGALPVRIGNDAHRQLQLDVYGEVMDLLHNAARHGLPSAPHVWALQCVLLEHLSERWREPDDGIWEVRGGRQHFTHSKVMAWVAFDRGIKSAERFGLDAPLARWRSERDAIHGLVCAEGYDPERSAFTQVLGGKALDASLLLLPLLGFLPADDPRVVSTAAAVERELGASGFVRRYEADAADDGLPKGEGAFLLCTFWLVDQQILRGDLAGARRRFERLVGLCNDVGLLSEQYDPVAGRMMGNFPQAFSHVALVNTALNLAAAVPRCEESPAEARSAL